VDVGARTFIGPWTTITSKAAVRIGTDCLIAERVTIRDQDHDIGGPLDVPIAQAGFRTAPIVIGDAAWIGAGAIVLKGVRIGRGAVVAANAVVNRDVADFEIVGGVPARPIGMREGRNG
jgi:acetyltransferase-like isoleucine patch superfamily enzyme